MRRHRREAHRGPAWCALLTLLTAAPSTGLQTRFVVHGSSSGAAPRIAAPCMLADRLSTLRAAMESTDALSSGGSTSGTITPNPTNFDTLGLFLGKLFVEPFTGPILRKLAPYDRGDFRWEFLTPWLDRDMNKIEKLIVFSSFIFLALTLQGVFDSEASYTVHLSQIAQFFAYVTTDRVGFRVLAIAAAVFEIFSHVIETPVPDVANDFIPVFYNSLFIVINSYYVLRWQLGKQSINFDPDEEALFSSCFEPLGATRQAFRKMLDGAVWHTVPQDGTEVVFTEGEPLRNFYVGISGNVQLIKSEVPVTEIEPFQVIGEAALLENLERAEGGRGCNSTARATMVAGSGTRYVSWPQTFFYRLMLEDAEFAYSAQLIISRTLSRKLGEARQQQQQMSDYVVKLVSEMERSSTRREIGENGIYGEDAQTTLVEVAETPQ